MGQVYRARDSKLNRDVAIKILPDHLAADADRLARFTREAQTLAALNHPNIAHMYGLEEAGGVRALVMELVEGEDLAEQMRRGPIPIDAAVDIARQIAEALEAAHEQGIVHRDLKPANIKVRPDGVVKVLDFGLAKAMARSDIVKPSGSPVPSGPDSRHDDRSQSPTLMTPAAMTGLGTVLGTAAYMAPEQAKGKAVDKRADIWAFGAIVYEMLAGRRLFDGDSVAESIGLIVTREPDWSALPSSTPIRIQQLLRRCLTKDPKDRLRDIGEARIVLARPDDAEPAMPAAPSGRQFRLGAALGAIGALIVAAIAAALFVNRTPSAHAVPLRRFELTGPIASASAGPVIAPDGSRLAYVSGNHLRVQALDSLESRDLGAVPITTARLRWSPDGQSIAFAGDSTIRSIPAAGGPAFVVCKVPATGSVLDIAWTADGTILFAVWRDTIYKVPSTGGTPEVFLAVDPKVEVDFHTITPLPGGRFIITTHVRDGDHEQQELYDGKTRSVLTTDPRVGLFTYAPPDHLIFVRSDANSGIWAVPFAGAAVDLTKAARIEAGDVDLRAGVADDGTVITAFRSAAVPKLELVWVDRQGAMSSIAGASIEFAERPAGQPAGALLWRAGSISLSPDGGRAVFVGTRGDVFVRDLATGLDTRLTFDERPYDWPSWFPGGDRILYVTEAHVTTAGSGFLGKIISQRADGTDKPKEIGAATKLPRVSHDGKFLLFIVDDRGRALLRIAAIGEDGTVGAAQPFFRGENEPSIASFDVSPDGRLLAYAAEDPSKRLDVFVTEFPTGNGRWQVHTGGTAPRFTSNGTELVFATGSLGAGGEAKGRLSAIAIASTPVVRLGAETALFDIDVPQAPSLTPLGYDVTRDGRRILASRVATPAGPKGHRVVLIQNWMAALTTR
ncbi:MAG: hypothetical protein DMF91_10140 [Acidobacteria bacterium]|nr:MAG: hypothetical protein DMF91_10140 [Acidobacteriota bacterium]